MTLSDKIDPNLDIIIRREEGNIQIKYNGNWHPLPILDEIVDINEGKEIVKKVVEIRYLIALYNLKNEVKGEEEKEVKKGKQKVYVI